MAHAALQMPNAARRFSDWYCPEEPLPAGSTGPSVLQFAPHFEEPGGDVVWTVRDREPLVRTERATGHTEQFPLPPPPSSGAAETPDGEHTAMSRRREIRFTQLAGDAGAIWVWLGDSMSPHPYVARFDKAAHTWTTYGDSGMPERRIIDRMWAGRRFRLDPHRLPHLSSGPRGGTWVDMSRAVPFGPSVQEVGLREVVPDGPAVWLLVGGLRVGRGLAPGEAPPIIPLLVRYDKATGQFQHFTPPGTNGLMGSSILADATGFLISTNAGLYHFDKTANTWHKVEGPSGFPPDTFCVPAPNHAVQRGTVGVLSGGSGTLDARSRNQCAMRPFPRHSSLHRRAALPGWLLIVALVCVRGDTPARPDGGARPNAPAQSEVRVTLTFAKEDVRAALKRLFDQAGAKYSLEAGVEGQVSVGLKDVRFETALQAILDSNSSGPLTYTITNGSYNVRRKAAVPVAAAPPKVDYSALAANTLNDLLKHYWVGTRRLDISSIPMRAALAATISSNWRGRAYCGSEPLLPVLATYYQATKDDTTRRRMLADWTYLQAAYPTASLRLVGKGTRNWALDDACWSGTMYWNIYRATGDPIALRYAQEVFLNASPGGATASRPGACGMTMLATARPAYRRSYCC